jgi:hypothetical protein
LNAAIKKTKKRKPYLITQNTTEEKTPENTELNGENEETNPDQKINRNEEINPYEEIDQNNERDRH